MQSNGRSIKQPSLLDSTWLVEDAGSAYSFFEDELGYLRCIHQVYPSETYIGHTDIFYIHEDYEFHEGVLTFYERDPPIFRY